MKIEEKRDGETKLTVFLSGRLETSTAPQLQKVVDEKLSGVLDFTVDMKQLEYVSSAGLRTLLSADKKMRAAGGGMKVRNANEEIMDVFAMTGFQKILTIE